MSYYSFSYWQDMKKLQIKHILLFLAAIFIGSIFVAANSDTPSKKSSSAIESTQKTEKQILLPTTIPTNTPIPTISVLVTPTTTPTPMPMPTPIPTFTPILTSFPTYEAPPQTQPCAGASALCADGTCSYSANR